ncbi:EF-hand calcium-binding domain-containing protein 11 isoform X3 [Anolis sagrei]|uniref:EF-hand calcium-binding domain-containing protein 11 isoform X3 n=1 Tax=Anolis sagrei TaxID=38937 RepID=UPI003522DAFA
MSAAFEMPEAGDKNRSQRKRWEKVFEACDEDKKGYLSREDYKVAVVMLFGYKPSKTEVNSAMASVKQNQSGKGFLSLEDLRKAFNIVAPKLPERTIVEVFREVDQDSDGHISYRDFELAMNYGEENVSALPFI